MVMVTTVLLVRTTQEGFASIMAITSTFHPRGSLWFDTSPRMMSFLTTSSKTVEILPTFLVSAARITSVTDMARSPGEPRTTDGASEEDISSDTDRTSSGRSAVSASTDVTESVIPATSGLNKAVNESGELTESKAEKAKSSRSSAVGAASSALTSSVTAAYIVGIREETESLASTLSVTDNALSICGERASLEDIWSETDKAY